MLEVLALRNSVYIVKVCAFPDVSSSRAHCSAHNGTMETASLQCTQWYYETAWLQWSSLTPLVWEWASLTPLVWDWASLTPSSESGPVSLKSSEHSARLWHLSEHNQMGLIFSDIEHHLALFWRFCKLGVTHKTHD